MTAFLTISVGTSPATARPLLVSDDNDVVRDAVRSIMGKVEAPAPTPGVLPLTPRGA